MENKHARPKFFETIWNVLKEDKPLEACETETDETSINLVNRRELKAW